MRDVRQVSPRVDPKTYARWTLDRLDGALMRWADQVYDRTDHPALGQAPAAAFTMGLAIGADRAHRQIPYDETFLMATLPTTPRGSATIQPNLGVKITSIYYWSDVFRDPDVERTAVPIRYDPTEGGIAYAFVQGRWAGCISEQYARLAGRSEREIQLATEELRRRQTQRAQHRLITARQLAEFLVSLDAEELLLEQRLRDLALRDVLQPTIPLDNEPRSSAALMSPTTNHPAAPSRRAVPLTTYEDYT
jgi:putative transposase